MSLNKTIDISYGGINPEDLEPEVVVELEKLTKHLKSKNLVKYGPFVAVFIDSNQNHVVPDRIFVSKVGPIGVLTYGAPNAEVGARAVRRIRKKLSTKYPEMVQPTSKSPLKTD